RLAARARRRRAAARRGARAGARRHPHRRRDGEGRDEDDERPFRGAAAVARQPHLHRPLGRQGDGRRDQDDHRRRSGVHAGRQRSALAGETARGAEGHSSGGTVKGAETQMTLIQRIGAAAVVAAVSGGLALSAAPSAAVRLVGVSSQTARRTAAVPIESTRPVAYAVSRPDPMTVLVDLRNVKVADAAAQITRKGPLAGVTLEQATAIDGTDLARVRVALSAPSSYKIRSARNIIRLELEPEAANLTAAERERLDGAPMRVRHETTPDDVAAAPATTIDRIRAAHTRTTTTVTLGGNGRLVPSSLSESDDKPRRLVLDFPNVSPAGVSHVGVDSVFVKQVRVALNSRDPLLTRV